MSAVGPVAKLLTPLMQWILREDGYREWAMRRQLAALRKDAKDALDRNDWVELRRATRALERLSNAP